jgi:hypothetical protein
MAPWRRKTPMLWFSFAHDGKIQTEEQTMITDIVVETRLTALEHAVAEIRKQISDVRHSNDWLGKVTGSISDEKAFLEALEYGRAYRNADRPADDNGAPP